MCEKKKQLFRPGHDVELNFENTIDYTMHGTSIHLQKKQKRMHGTSEVLVCSGASHPCHLLATLSGRETGNLCALELPSMPSMHWMPAMCPMPFSVSFYIPLQYRICSGYGGIFPFLSFPFLSFPGFLLTLFYFYSFSNRLVLFVRMHIWTDTSIDSSGW